MRHSQRLLHYTKNIHFVNTFFKKIILFLDAPYTYHVQYGLDLSNQLFIIRRNIMFVKYLILFFISMVPIVELRGAIPYSVVFGLPLIPFITSSV